MTPKRVTLVVVLVVLASISAVSSMAVLKYAPGFATYLGATKGADCTAERARFGSDWVTLPIDTEILDGEVSLFQADTFTISVLCVQGKLSEIQYQFSGIPTP
jgi:hypothetical protein